MTYYYGSTEPNLKTIEASEAKLSTSKMIAAFCLANPLEELDYWFPCDFGSDGTIQYQELYPNALKEYAGNMLLVGINYDKKSKKHECRIETYMK